MLTYAAEAEEQIRFEEEKLREEEEVRNFFLIPSKKNKKKFV
jgi:hypothetical protein